MSYCHCNSFFFFCYFIFFFFFFVFFFFQAEYGIRYLVRSRGLGDVYKRQVIENLNPADYLASVQKIDQLLKDNSLDDLYKKIRIIAETKRNFSVAREIYKQIY